MRSRAGGEDEDDLRWRQVRIPFLPRVRSASDLGVEESRLRFIADTRGGSAFLLAGAAFWLSGAVVSVLVPVSP